VRTAKKVMTCITGTLAGLFLLTSSASAHITVQPGEALTADWLTFTVSVPNEKQLANTEIKLLIPAGVEHVTPTVKQGWQIAVQKDGEGEAATVKSITWSGGSIPSGFRDDFTFSGKTPDTAGDLQWKSYQTYADGSTVGWDLSESEQPKQADGSPDFSTSGPYSVTAVASQPAESPATASTADTTGAKDKWALYIAGVAAVLSLLAIFWATRKAPVSKE
jgi:uncharacterized protein YcnI